MRSSDRTLKPAVRTVERGSMTALTVVCLLFLAVSIARGGNIFDDDWQAPRASTQPAVSTSTTPTSANPPISSPIPEDLRPKTGRVVDAAPSVPANRKPIPSAVEQAKVRKLFREVYGKQLADRTPGGRAKLAEALLNEAGKSSDAPVDQFVMLAGARAAAMESGDVEEAMSADDRLSGIFAIDAARSRFELLTGAARSIRDASSGSVLSQKCLADAQAAAESGIFDDARKLIDAAITAARASGEAKLVGRVNAQVVRVRDYITGFTKIQKSLAVLKTNPTDAQANLEVGTFYCFVAGKWADGLPFLAAGADPALAATAAADLKSADRASVGEMWANLAEKQPPTVRQRMRGRAAKWFREAAQSLQGLARVQMENRLSQLNGTAFRATSVELTLHNDDPKKILLQKGQGLATLASISGSFKGGAELAGFSLTEDESWEAKVEAVKTGIVSNFIVYQRADGLGLSAEIREYQWKRGEAKVKMIHKSEGFCFLSQIRGKLEGDGEKVAVAIGADGYWYIDCRVDQDLWIRAISVKPASPRTFSSDYREVTWKKGSKPVPVMPQEDGIVFLTSIHGGMHGLDDHAGLKLGADGIWYVGGVGGRLEDVKAMGVRYLADESR